MNETIDREAQEIERSWQSYLGPWILGSEPCVSFWAAVRGLWQSAPDWHTMTELNRRYLQRRLPVCAGYPSPPEEETDRFTNLLRLHDYGIISTNSCPSWEDHIKYFPTFARQRAYLNFSIPTTHTLFVNAPEALCNFVKKLKNSEEVYVYIRFKYDDAPDGVQRDQDIQNLMPYGCCCSFPDSTSKEWEEEKWRIGGDDDGDDSFLVPQEQRRQDYDRAWSYFGSQTVHWFGSDFDDDDNPIRASHANDPLQISVYAKDWNYRDIGQLIERLLIDSGILPGFVARG